MQVSTSNLSVLGANEANTCTALVPYRDQDEVIRTSLAKWRAMPCIVYFKATSCAGKSTLGRAFEQQLNDWVFIDDDVIAYRQYLEAIAQRFPHEYAIVGKAVSPCNLYHAFRFKDVLFYESASDSDRVAAKDALAKVQNELDNPESSPWISAVNQQVRTELIDRVQLAFQQKKNVLVDSWFFNAGQFQEHFPGARVMRLMMYCSLPVAMQRLKKRNQEGLATENIESKRYISQLMGSFCSLYLMSKSPAQPVESVAKTELEAQFVVMTTDVKKASTTGVKKPFTRQEVALEDFEKMRAQFLLPYDSENANHLFIAPKETQDFIINGSFETQKTIASIKQVVRILL